MEAKEEIRSKLNIEDVVGEYVQLKRAGRNFKGLSPFSSEKTPSFMVSPDKHIWHDFSSNKGGDIFAFVMEVEGLDFRGALELLARKAGVDLSLYSKGDKELSRKKARLYDILELTTKFYQQSLISNKTALEYVFKKRGLSKQIVQDFRIGYSPNVFDGLVKILLKRGFTGKELQDAGIATLRRGRLSDMFRGRMMVPLSDGQGRVVGFTARLIEDQPDAPKYINTPQTLLYDKGRQVFGLHMAKEAIRKANYAVIVEGNLDVVSSHQAGVAQVVAAAGTALTDQHLKSLSRLTHDIRLAFDKDKAGIAATERAIGIASTLGIQLSIVSVPDGVKDPDELIQDDPAKWVAVLQEPQNAMEWLLDEYAKRFDLTTAEGKRKATSQALLVINKVDDAVEQEHYIRRLAERTGASEEAIQRKMSGAAEAAVQPKPLKPAKTTPSMLPHELTLQDKLLALTWCHPLLRSVLEDFEPVYFEGAVRQAVMQLMQKLGENIAAEAQLQALQSDEVHVKIKELELLSEQLYPTFTETLREIAADMAKKVLLPQKMRQKDHIARELPNVEDEAVRNDMNEQYKTLLKEIEKLKH